MTINGVPIQLFSYPRLPVMSSIALNVFIVAALSDASNGIVHKEKFECTSMTKGNMIYGTHKQALSSSAIHMTMCYCIPILGTMLFRSGLYLRPLYLSQINIVVTNDIWRFQLQPSPMIVYILLCQ
jgi:hypothetical protein